MTPGVPGGRDTPLFLANSSIKKNFGDIFMRIIKPPLIINIYKDEILLTLYYDNRGRENSRIYYPGVIYVKFKLKPKHGYRTII